MADITFIMFKRKGKFALAACRGDRKGCLVMQRERSKRGPCPDCLACDDPNETVEQVLARVNRGDG